MAAFVIALTLTPKDLSSYSNIAINDYLMDMQKEDRLNKPMKPELLYHFEKSPQ
jgi:hypothetical protein